jgi:hypothetical protein
LLRIPRRVRSRGPGSSAAGAQTSTLDGLEFLFTEVVPTPHGICHGRQRLLTQSGPISLFECPQFVGKRTIAEYVPNPARRVAALDVTREERLEAQYVTIVYPLRSKSSS